MKEELNPKLWTDNMNINSDVRKKLLQIARDFITYVEVKNLKIYDIVLTGSIANYTWHSKSDVDLHVIFDLTPFRRHEEFIKKLIMSKKSIWNSNHDITIFDFPVEIYPEDKAEQHFSSGIYSLAKNEWISEPAKHFVVVNKELIKKKYYDKINEIYYIIGMYENDKSKYKESIQSIEVFLERLRDSRKEALATNGEFATENLVYKILRNNGLLQKLHDIKEEIYDKELSMEIKIK